MIFPNSKPAENLFGLDCKPVLILNDSINLYKEVLKTGKDTESSKIAAYFLGMYYDYEAAQIDSAKFYYNLVARDFPLSEQGQKASKRLEIFYAK